MVEAYKAQGGIVLACSALKGSYRRLLDSAAAEPAWLFLEVPEAELRRRGPVPQGTATLDPHLR